MTPDTIGWLVILTAIVAPLAGLVWLGRTRPAEPPAISTEAEFDLHCADTPGLVDRRPERSWESA